MHCRRQTQPIVERYPTTCGGFVDIPSKENDWNDTESRIARVKYMKKAENTECDDSIILRGTLLERRASFLVYSCGGLLLKLFDVDGEEHEEFVVRVEASGVFV